MTLAQTSISGRFVRFAAAAALGLAAAISPVAASAHSYKLGSLRIGHVWAKPAAKGEDAIVYGPIFNTAPEPAALKGASSPAATATELRSAVDGANKRLDAIALPPGRPVALAPWREHIVLTGLKQPLQNGDAVDLDLDFGSLGKISVQVEIEDQASD
ncbi:copper chaperone PCu(A)C [Aurantimonas sp. VKM B-3413]|uniref:copper chaperone PCu(A)C n=1 Tax=Aurantimonas sp. VKM B-3413 TaxID=2779401 RepID=UPI001E5F4955|nr:copper chaperone PCu(A)C [Aurantimonas sp. VKM B-3413]MCB8837848.1 copper chaperone PCu(A)C [Aurantimonas sp. VKM B-3413]